MEFLNYTGYLPMILDIALVIIFIVSVISMARRGLIKSLYRLVSIVVTVVLVAVLITPVTTAIENSQAGAVIYRSVGNQIEKQSKESLSSGEGAGVNAESVWDMPEYIKNSGQIQQITDTAISNSTRVITQILIKIIAAVGLFIIIKLILALIFLIIEGVFKMPILKSINTIAGAFTAILTVFTVIYLILGVISLDLPMFDSIKYVISQTYLVRLFYDYNFLMAMFL